MGFIGGTSDRPAPISDKEVDAIMNRLQQVGDKPVSYTHLFNANFYPC